jgi:hypothetical protein
LLKVLRALLDGVAAQLDHLLARRLEINHGALTNLGGTSKRLPGEVANYVVSLAGDGPQCLLIHRSHAMLDACSG